jgi:hypothetical protein
MHDAEWDCFMVCWWGMNEWINNIVIFRAMCAFNPSFSSHLAWLSVGLLTNYIPDHSCLIFHGFTNKLHLRTPLVALCQFVISLLHIAHRVLSDTVGWRGRYSDWLWAGRSRDWIPLGGKIFCTCPDWPWSPPSLLYSGCRVFPRGTEQPGHDADPSPPTSAMVKKG